MDCPHNDQGRTHHAYIHVRVWVPPEIAKKVDFFGLIKFAGLTARDFQLALVLTSYVRTPQLKIHATPHRNSIS